MSTQTSFDVEAIESANRHQQDMELPSGKSSNRREGGKKAAVTRKANAAKKAESEPVKGGTLTAEQVDRIEQLTSLEYARREAFAEADVALRDATEARRHYMRSITAGEK